MLIHWLKLALRLLACLIIPPPPVPVIPVMDPCAPCPACGHRDGEIECVKDHERVYVQHTCHVCSARWNTPTVCDSANILGANEGEPVRRAPQLPAGSIYGL